jgi:predicted hotdog family 3-hydroxylacyl-ACP dehydratase
MLDRAWILAHIPHQAGMCLLDGVARWSDASIECFAGSHRELDNPLRQNGRLGSACAIEYGAQAMAIHGALAGIGQRDARPGYLVSVRGVELHVTRLDDIADDLAVSAERLVAEQERVLYQFTVAAAGRTLCSGRAAVVLAGGER